MCLPEWEDNVELANYNKTLIDSLDTTYPRFLLHKFVKQVRIALLCFLFMFFVHVLP
jgi:hypothetical protein